MRRGRRALVGVLGATLVVFGLSLSPGSAAGNGAIDLVGTVGHSHGDDFKAGHEVNQHFVLATSSGTVDLNLPPGVQLTLGKKVRLHGHFEGSTFAVAANGSSGTGGTTVAAATGNQTVAVILFNFSTNTSQPWSPSTVRGVVFDNANSVNAYYQDSSDGAISMSGDVLGWYTIANSTSSCDYNGWATAARSAATSAGVNLSAYKYTVYAFPSTSSCNWAGLGYLPGTTSWINGAMNLRVVAHELGHNFGVHHASSQSCTQSGIPVTLSATCTLSEYGDPFTVMGSASTRMHHNWHRAQLGWLSSTQTISASGDYTLAPTDGPGSPRLMRIARSDGTYFQLEFRQPTGLFDNFSVSEPAVNGVTVRIAPAPTTIVQSKLLDMTPETTTFADAPLAVGKTFVDPFTGMQITTKSVSAGGAVVGVSFTPDAQAPTTPVNLAATANSTTSIGLTWGASTDNVGVAGYTIRRNGAVVATTTGTTYTDTGLTSSTTYSYTVAAYDAAPNESAQSNQASATTLSVDTQAPSAPTNLKASVARSKTVTLTWSASTDNVGVAGYRVFRNGVQVGTTTSTGFPDRPSRGTFTYRVVAYDAAANVSAPSTDLTVKV